MFTPNVYIVIVNYQQWQDAIECLGSVLDSDYKNFSVIIIDNCSKNNSSKYLTEWISDISVKRNLQARFLNNNDLEGITGAATLPVITFIQNNVNAGFGAGNNIVLKLLQAEDAYIWLLNPDMVIEKNTLGQFMGCAKQLPQNSILGGVIRSYSQKEKILFYGGGRIYFSLATVGMIKSPAQSEKLDYISGACLFTHAVNFKRIGLLPEDYFLYWEETDWCYHARQQGIKLHVCKEARSYDKISTTIGKSFLAEYYYTRNGLLFISRYRKKNVPVALFFVGFRFFKRVFSGRLDRARGVYKGVRDFFKAHYYENK